ILLNLLTNAIKFTPEGGRITVRARTTDTVFEIAVGDNGIGMRREELPKALEFFGQLDDGLDRRQQGAGIGLPLSKILMERHGGRLEIASAPGEGTTVTLLFPRPAEGAQRLEVA
ncbi:MAG: sensor histidine kinase, partial [Geminicoccales bacterium]